MARGDQDAVAQYRALRAKRSQLAQKRRTVADALRAAIEEYHAGSTSVLAKAEPVPAERVAFASAVAAALERPAPSAAPASTLAPTIRDLEQELTVLDAAVETIAKEEQAAWRGYSTARFDAEFRAQHERLAKDVMASLLALLAAAHRERAFVAKLAEERVEACCWSDAVGVEPRERQHRFWGTLSEAAEVGLVSRQDLEKLEGQVLRP
jgi:hypothetical protein